MAMSGLRRVLLLGSGYTAAPLVECLTREGTVAVTVGKEIWTGWREGRKSVDNLPGCLPVLGTVCMCNLIGGQ